MNVQQNASTFPSPQRFSPLSQQSNGAKKAVKFDLDAGQDLKQVDQMRKAKLNQDFKTPPDIKMEQTKLLMLAHSSNRPENIIISQTNLDLSQIKEDTNSRYGDVPEEAAAGNPTQINQTTEHPDQTQQALSSQDLIQNPNERRRIMAEVRSSETMRDPNLSARSAHKRIISENYTVDDEIHQFGANVGQPTDSLAFSAPNQTEGSSPDMDAAVKSDDTGPIYARNY